MAVVLALAIICLIWYIFIVLVSLTGYVQLLRYYSSPLHRADCETTSSCPHVSIIRPIKGLEPNLYECLAATFRQTYPKDKLTIFFCVSDRHDPALPVIERLLHDFPSFDAQLLVEDEDPMLQEINDELGPNPKIRNMSRAYREAKGDIVWIIDCNVWVAKGTCGRMIDTLHGRGETPNKFVHCLPLVVDVLGTPVPDYAQGLLDNQESSLQATTTSTAVDNVQSRNSNESAWLYGGGRLEEMFMSSSHAKFYTAINTVLIAPCIVGKSTMFRRSHLNSLTDDQGIDSFSENICEDHLIGDLLWKQKVPEEQAGEKWAKHAMVFGDIAIQPMAGMSIKEYVARRTRWLRVRKFTVPAATLVEHGTESFFCSLYGAFAWTTLPFFSRIGVAPTWTSFGAFWLVSIMVWCLVDWTLYLKLHSGASLEIDDDTPAFARPPKHGRRRPFHVWLVTWLGRETLAFPIWAWAVFGGVSVTWRGKRFWVGLDMKVHEIGGQRKPLADETSQHLSKTRRD